MKFIDFFAGIGGFREGLEHNGHKCVGWCEYDKFKQQAYRTVHNTEGEWFKDDITDVQPGELPEADLYVGGFPCQSFSIAGNRGGFEDTRGTLFFEFMRLAKERKPKYLLLENVKGLLNHDKGNTFSTILNTLAEFRYEWQYQVLNSKDFGVPQNRERVFIIGHLRGQSRPKVFPIREKTSRIKKDGRYILAHNIYGGFNEKKARIFDKYSPTIRTPKGGGHLPCVVDKEKGIRKITPLECFRLQGFPDDWYYKCKQVGMSDNQLYRVAGDSVTVNVVKEIGRRLHN